MDCKSTNKYSELSEAVYFTAVNSTTNENENKNNIDFASVDFIIFHTVNIFATRFYSL